MNKKILLVSSLCLISIFGLTLFASQAKGASYSFNEDFGTINYRDNAFTTADWNTVEKKAQLPESSSVKLTTPRANRTSLGGILTENRIYLVFGKYAKTSVEAYQTNSSQENEIYLQAQTEGGTIRWTTKVSDKSALYSRYNPIVKADTSDGYVYVIWAECLNLFCSDANIMAQKFDANGNKLWGDGKELINSANFDSGGQWAADVQMFVGYSNYIFLFYSDKVDGKMVVKKINPATGQEIWKQTVDAYRNYATITVSGQVYIAYQKQEGSLSNNNIYAAKIDNTLGTLIWSKKINNDMTSVMRIDPKIFERDNFITVTWIDFRSGRRDAFAQKLDSGGSKQWINEVEVVTDMRSNYDTGIDWNNNLYAVWDSRQNELRMQKFGPNGSKSYADSVVVNNQFVGQFFNVSLAMAGSGVGTVYWASGMDNRLYGELFNGQSISFGGKKFNIPFYSTSGSITQSNKINTFSDAISKATLIGSDETPQNTSITYYLSANGGTNWEQVSKGVEHNFTKPGNDLRWKAVLSTQDSASAPFINSVSISYNTEANVASSVTVTSPNGGETITNGSPLTIFWNVSSSMLGKSYKNIVSLFSAINGAKDYRINKIICEFNGIVNVNPSQCAISEYWQWSNIISGNYIIEVSVVDEVTNQGVADISNASFSVVAPTPTPTPTSIPTPTPTSTPTPLPTPSPTPTPSSCLPDNTLVKIPGDSKVYVILDCKKKWIQTAEEFKEEGYKWTDVKEVNSPVVQAYTDYQRASVNLLKAIGQERVYKVVNNKLLWVPTISAFNAQGLKWSDVQSVDTSQLNQYQRVKLVQAVGDEKVYYITESGLKRHIPNETVFDSYNNKWEDIVKVTATDVNFYPDATLIKAEDGYQVYKIENGQKRWIKTDAAFRRLKLDWNKVVPVNSTELTAYPDGAVIE